MNNLFSYCGLTDARMRASDTDLPVKSVNEALTKGINVLQRGRSGRLQTTGRALPGMNLLV